jgi:hypothetical protein
MSLTKAFRNALDSGANQIGQLRILRDPIRLHHIEDSDLDSLKVHTDPNDAREVGLYTPKGEYRFTKGELSLPTGWIFHLDSVEELRRTIDLFYPASLGLWKAWKKGDIRVQNLRDKLNRQSGMYRPSNKCVKKILWKIDDEQSLEDSEASRFNGIVGKSDEATAIPMVCQEACNFFVAQARKKSKEEFETKSA